MRALLSLLVSMVLVSGIVGCDSGSGRPRRDSGIGGDGDGGPGSGESGAQCSDGIDNDMDGLFDCDESGCRGTAACAHDAGPGVDGGFMGCDSVDFAAETSVAPVDIVWIIDNSGSMDEETDLIQTNLNTFVSSLTTSGIEDYHVVVITNPAAFGLSVPPPLGTDTARFRLVSYDIQSNDALSKLIETYSMWSDFIRPDSIIHFIHVTDDESSMAASTFRTMMTGLLGGRSFTSHAIASPPGSRHCDSPFGCGGIIPESDGCSGTYGDAADNGDEYWSIAGMTGGLTISICSPDWSAVFRQLEMTIGVPMPIPCEFLIPEPPAGMTFDRTRVNVVYTPGGGGASTTFPYVGHPDGSATCGGGNGWYYDDPMNPTQIILCPTTCDLVEADSTGAVNIALGCETFFG